MKKFLKRLPEQIAAIFTIMIFFFIAAVNLNGIKSIPVERLEQLLFLAAIGGALMEFVFGQYIFEHISDTKKVGIFIIPFSIITFLCAIVFEWITQLDQIETYLQFVSGFLICGIVSIILFELEHRLRGKAYTKKLKEYQNGGNKNDK